MGFTDLKQEKARVKERETAVVGGKVGNSRSYDEPEPTRINTRDVSVTTTTSIKLTIETSRQGILHWTGKNAHA